MSTTTPVRVCGLDELPLGEGRAFALGDTQVALFRTRAGSVHAVQAICPHAGGPLADGQSDDTVVVCPLHAHTFELGSGACRTGQPALTVYPVTVEREAVFVELPAP